MPKFLVTRITVNGQPEMTLAQFQERLAKGRVWFYGQTEETYRWWRQASKDDKDRFSAVYFAFEEMQYLMEMAEEALFSVDSKNGD